MGVWGIWKMVHCACLRWSEYMPHGEKRRTECSCSGRPMIGLYGLLDDHLLALSFDADDIDVFWQILYGVRLAWVDENSVALVDTYMRNASKMNVSIVDTDFWKFRQSVVSAAESLFVAAFLVTAELAVLLLPFLTVGDGGESCAVATYCSIAVLALRGDVRVFCVVADDCSLFLVCVCKYRSRGNHCHNCYQTENHLFHFLIPWIRVGRNF